MLSCSCSGYPVMQIQLVYEIVVESLVVPTAIIENSDWVAISFEKRAMNGDVPGLVKASW